MTRKELLANQRKLKNLGANHKRGKLWGAARMLREFTCEDLAAVCEMENVQSIRTYICQLARVGYFTSTQHGRQRTYRLARNTGPLPPYFMRLRTVIYDQNTQQEFIYVKR